MAKFGVLVVFLCFFVALDAIEYKFPEFNDFVETLNQEELRKERMGILIEKGDEFCGTLGLNKISPKHNEDVEVLLKEIGQDETVQLLWNIFDYLKENIIITKH